MHKITPSAIKTWLAQLNNLESMGKSPLSAKYIESIANQLGSILRAAVADKFLVDSPMSRVKRKKAARVNRVIPLDYETVESIANSMSPKFRAIVWTGYYTGMRPSEVLGLVTTRHQGNIPTCFKPNSASLRIHWIGLERLAPFGQPGTQRKANYRL
jgi:integrase